MKYWRGFVLGGLMGGTGYFVGLTLGHETVFGILGWVIGMGVLVLCLLAWYMAKE